MKPVFLQPEIWDVATHEPVYSPVSIEAGVHTHVWKMRETEKYIRVMQTVEAIQAMQHAYARRS